MVIERFIKPRKLYLSRENSAPFSATSQMRETLAVILRNRKRKDKMKLKIFTAISILTFSLTFSQVKDRVVKGHEVKIYLDSLKRIILLDTIKFSRKDLIHSNMQTTYNTKPYSPLFVIEKYLYKLDIIEGNLVKDFVDEILNDEKIESLIIIESHRAISLFGSNAEGGVIWMTPKKKQKINYKIAGLKKVRKRTWNNFDQRKIGEIQILH